MNFKKLMRGVAMLCAGTILWASCKKENDTMSVPSTEETSSNLKQSGVAPDDPALVAKVPMIASADYMAEKVTNYFSSQPLTEARGGGGSRDRTTPSVNINNPLNGAVVSGTVTVQVSATDNVGVTSVVLKADGNTVGTSNAAPYNFYWNTSGISSGTHTLTATATDAAGNSKSHNIQVGYNTPAGSDITPPSVSITSPVNGSSVSSTISVAVSASDNVGVSNVTLYVDGAVLSSDAAAPYNFSLNTGTLSSGVHTISAIARDAAGNNNSNAIQVSVNTEVISPPSSLPSSVVLLMPPVQNQGGEGSCVAFAVGYAARSCEKYYSSGASSYSESVNILSPEYLFNQTKTTSYCSSSPLLVALDFLKNNGICTWQSMPYTSNDCSLMPTTSQTSEAGNFRISSYSQIATTDIAAIKTLLYNKHPLVMTFTPDSYFSNATPGFIWKSYSPTLYARHAVAICGYDDSKNAFKVINSWGTGWGDNGYSWIDYGFLSSLNPSVYSMNF